MVSAWAYASGRNVPFEEWLLEPQPWSNYGVDMKRTPQTFWTFRCNHTVKYETLSESWPKLLERMNLPFVALPSQNSSKHEDYRGYYSPKTIEVVADRFAPDIQQFGYTYE